MWDIRTSDHDAHGCLRCQRTHGNMMWSVADAVDISAAGKNTYPECGYFVENKARNVRKSAELFLKCQMTSWERRRTFRSPPFAQILHNDNSPSETHVIMSLDSGERNGVTRKAVVFERCNWYLFYYKDWHRWWLTLSTSIGVRCPWQPIGPQSAIYMIYHAGRKKGSVEVDNRLSFIHLLVVGPFEGNIC